MKKFFMLLTAAIILLLSSCQNQISSEDLKNEYVLMLNQYYFNYPEIKSTSDLKDFIEYINLNYSDLEYIENMHYNLELDTVKEVLKITRNNLLSNPSVKINLNSEIGRPNWCRNDISIKGFFSKKYSALQQRNFLKEINDSLNKIFNDSIGVPLYNLKSLSSSKKVLYKYEDDSLSLKCRTDQTDIKLLLDIQNKLKLILENQKEIPFDYGLIPVEIH